MQAANLRGSRGAARQSQISNLSWSAVAELHPCKKATISLKLLSSSHRKLAAAAAAAATEDSYCFFFLEKKGRKLKKLNLVFKNVPCDFWPYAVQTLLPDRIFHVFRSSKSGDCWIFWFRNANLRKFSKCSAGMLKVLPFCGLVIGAFPYPPYPDRTF